MYWAAVVAVRPNGVSSPWQPSNVELLSDLLRISPSPPFRTQGSRSTGLQYDSRVQLTEAMAVVILVSQGSDDDSFSDLLRISLALPSRTQGSTIFAL
jgi:hypothetical protein